MQPADLPAASFRLALDARLRAAAEDDLAALEWEGAFTHHRELIRDAYAQQRRGDLVMLVADVGGFPVGQVWVDLVRRRAASAGFLYALRVLPWLTGAGIGGRLLAGAEALLRRGGLAAAEICVETWNVRALRLYERAGYAVVERVRERYAYTPPGRARETIALDEWMLRKALAPEAARDAAPAEAAP